MDRDLPPIEVLSGYDLLALIVVVIATFWALEHADGIGWDDEEDS